MSAQPAYRRRSCGLILAALVAGALTSGVQAQKKDYLTELEANKIREAEEPALRIKLFVGFAADRLKKFQYELGRPSPDRRRGERLNALLNAYAGCIDDATDLIVLGRDKQQDIRAGLKEMQAKGKEFLTTLEGLAANGAELESYKETLRDAIEATQEALAEAEKAAKEIAPPPVRRRQ